MAPPVIFIFGLGYVGRRFGHMMAASGWSVRGTTRQPDNFAAERAAGWNIIPFSDQQKMPEPARSLDGVSAILSTIGTELLQRSPSYWLSGDKTRAWRRSVIP